MVAVESTLGAVLSTIRVYEAVKWKREVIWAWFGGKLWETREMVELKINENVLHSAFVGWRFSEMRLVKSPKTMFRLAGIEAGRFYGDTLTKNGR